MDYSNEFTLEEFQDFMKDPIFKKVKALGINGGEPSLIKALPDFADAMLSLPSLKALNIITHGFNKKLLLPALEKMYASCKSKGVSFHVSISLDGYGQIHNTVRGLKVFELTDASIQEIVNNPGKYCDTFDVGCTIMRQNVDYLIELDQYAKINNYPMKYRMGIENKRIESDKLVDQYSLFLDGHMQSAREFFHKAYRNANNLVEKFKYFSIHYFITAPQPKRLLGCHWQENGITMDSRGDLYYCAVESEKIGSLREQKGEKIFFSDTNLDYRSEIIEHKCNECIHDYYGKPQLKNILFFLKSVYAEKLYFINYILKNKLMGI
jgi:sulfatase maturation enzyme AslB (radical SAM superfamily)